VHAFGRLSAMINIEDRASAVKVSYRRDKTTKSSARDDANPIAWCFESTAQLARSFRHRVTPVVSRVRQATTGARDLPAISVPKR
jgi:hypothetical protein